MKYDEINSAMDKLKSIAPAYENLIKNYSDNLGKKIIASPFYFVPPEINSAFDIVTLKIPEFILNHTLCDEKLAALYDAVIIPEKEC